MRITLFKLLTLAMLLLSSVAALSSYAIQEKQKSYLRWKFSATKNHLAVNREGDRLRLEVSDENLFTHIKKEIQGFARDGQYMESIEFDSSGKENGIFSIQVRLKENVELFSFYRDREKKHVIDFWKEIEEVSVKKPLVKASAPPVKKEKPVVQKIAVAPSSKKKSEGAGKKAEYRDFRYGAAFYWNYAPLEVHFEKLVDLRSKTPEFFYPIQDRDYRKSDKEAHLQLSVNMYRKRKWGLMYNSIKLYKEKYGESDNFEINEYLKANAIIRDNLQKRKKGPAKTALNILNTIEKKSSNYALRKGIVKYSLQHHLDLKDYMGALKSAKKFYIMTVEKNDDSDARVAARAILFSLSKLNQISEIQNILEEKDMIKYLSKNTVLLYETYSHMRMGNSKKVIAIYKREKNNFAKPLHESILFNVAEAAFREADFALAIRLFDEFLAKYSYHIFSSWARVRLALIYELQQKPLEEVAFLYKNAINRSQNIKASLEAKIRYVALKNIRKINPTEQDKETRLFLNIDEKDRKNVDVNIKKILWIVRTRLLISDEKYQDALAYLKTIPLPILKPIERRVFDAEGAEVVYGIMSSLYKKSEYSEIIKFWNVYKEKYIDKVANDSMMNFIVGRSYLKLGLYDEFDSIYKNTEKLSGTPEKTFPIWVERHKGKQNFDILQELMIEKNLTLNNLKLAQRDVERLKEKNSENGKVSYYEGILFYKNKKYKDSVKKIEHFLSNEKNQEGLSPEEVGGLLMAYSDSVYKLGDMNKFKRVSQAVLKDTESYAQENKFMKNLRERLSYLVIEINFTENGKKIHEQLGKDILRFKDLYKKSIYSDRIDYILGRYYVKNNDLKKAKKIFDKILSNKDASKNVKGLVKAELAMLSIQNKKL